MLLLLRVVSSGVRIIVYYGVTLHRIGGELEQLPEPRREERTERDDKNRLQQPSAPCRGLWRHAVMVERPVNGQRSCLL